MKRISIFLLALFLAAAMWTPTSALTPPHTNVVSSGVVTAGINNFYEDQATMLNELGLFLGTGSGFALERGMTRAEAAAMLVRFLGEESTALSQDWAHPFSDVPDWADRYVGWLYQNKLTKGTSETTFSASQHVTYWQYATFLSRACSGKDDFLAVGIGREAEQKAFESPGSVFLRADAVGLSVRALMCNRSSDPTDTMARFLVEKKVFTAEQWFEAARNIYTIDYKWGFAPEGRVTAEIAGVVVLISTLTDVDGGVMTYSDRPHFYVYTYDKDDALVLYQMDCLTLKETWLGRYPKVRSLTAPLMPWLQVFGTVDGVDYLEIRQRYLSDIVRVRDGKAETVFARVGYEGDYDADKGMIESSFVSDSAILVTTNKSDVYVLTKDTAQRRTLLFGGAVAGLLDGLAVVCYREEDKAIVEGIEAGTWTVVDRYEGPTNGQAFIPDLRQYDDKIYGPAGVYRVSEGRLRQITARPTMDVGYMREGAGSAWVIVSGQPGAYRGDTIVRVGNTWDFGGDDTVLLSNDPPHGIGIAGLLSSEVSNTVLFYSAEGVGMEHYDQFIYMLTNMNQKQPVIWVLSYEAGRPEMMEHDESWYIQREQERLNKLGFGYKSE